MQKETSKANIQKAQDTRRLIGVSRFLEKLREYRGNPELWQRILQEFGKQGFSIKETRK